MVPITLAGTTYQMTPRFEAIASIEQKAGSFIALARKLAQGDISLSELACIIEAAIDADNAPIGEALVMGDLPHAMDAVAAMMITILGKNGSEETMSRDELEQLRAKFPDATAPEAVSTTHPHTPDIAPAAN